MTSSLSRVFRSSKSGFAAQDLITRQNFTLKNGMLRKKGKTLNIGKWPHRFVVLTHDFIFVYKNEYSRTPNTQFSLTGYNRVTRCEVKGQDWCFSIMPASNKDSTKVRTFACFSNADRKAWMQAIKSQMYAANNIPKPVMTVLDQIKSMTIGESDEDFYLTIEDYVYKTNNETVVEIDSHGDSDEDEDDDDESDISHESDSEVCAPVYKKTTRSQSLPNNSMLHASIKHSQFSNSRKLSEDSTEQQSSDYETCNDLFHSPQTSEETKRRKPSDPLPKIRSNFSWPPSEGTTRPNSYISQVPPPRYSEVYKVEEENSEVSKVKEEHSEVSKVKEQHSEVYKVKEQHSEVYKVKEQHIEVSTVKEEHSCEHDYANWASIKSSDYECFDPPSQPSLVSMCSITDTNIDREQLIILLREKEPSTYLIRKSRTESRQVIAVLNKNGDVNEYKILGTEDKPTIDGKIFFSCVEELLQHYTSVEPLPNTNVLLKRGFHQVNMDT